MNFLQTFSPQPIAFSFGSVHIFWYGVIIVFGIIIGTIVTASLAKKNNIEKDTIYDLAYYLIIFSIVGARIYDCLLEAPYYLEHPEDIIKIWRGGLAIHGAMIGGVLTIYFYARKHKLELVKLIGIVVPGLALGQAIGRWGNYFNQELFGRPTDLPWGIFISPANRPGDFASQQYFHPTFLYESLGCLILAGILIYLHQKLQHKKKYLIITATYLLGYSLLRFGLEFIRIDYAPDFIGLRVPQIMSLLIIIVTSSYRWFSRHDLTRF